jgi:acylphosphatase
MRGVRVNISGQVQGVFFRVSCARRAEEVGVAGWIRNERDGSVTAVFEGTDEAVDSLVSWCRQGPAYARVDAVDVKPEPPVGRIGFRVEP